MKRRNLKKLELKKTAISKFNVAAVKGGTATTTTLPPTNLFDCGNTIYLTRCYGERLCRRYGSPTTN